MPELKVLRCGAFGSVQDMGRTGFRHWGIPVSGALDENSAKSANLNLGNPENPALLELIGPGWEFEFSQDTNISICGSDWHPEINQKRVSLQLNNEVKSGDILTMKFPGKGRIAYLGIAGGFQTEETLGSRSWHPQLTEPFMLKKNMLLPYSKLSNTGFHKTPLSSQFQVITDHKFIIAEPGPEWNHLSAEAILQLNSLEWSISNRSNRMAYFIEQKLLVVSKTMLTAAVWPGIVQLTPSGQMMILMKDAQTTGGYPRILSIPQEELNKIAQKNPGDKFRFSVSKLI